MNLLQVQIGGAARPFAVVDVRPQPQPALARQQGRAQPHMLAQLRYIHLRKIGKRLAVPVLEVAGVAREQMAVEPAHQHEALAPVGGWGGVQAQVVVVQAVAQHQIDIGQRQRTGLLWVLPCAGAGPLRGPAHGAATHHHLALAEQPVRGGIVLAARGAQCQTGHQPLAVGRVADVQFGVIEHQLFQPQVQHRAHADGHHHARQGEGGPPFAVQQPDLPQLERRITDCP